MRGVHGEWQTEVNRGKTVSDEPEMGVLHAEAHGVLMGLFRRRAGRELWLILRRH